jgi:hypothetical protein
MFDSSVEILGICAVTVMVTSYALEDRYPLMILLFAAGCATAAFYAYLIQSYPFMIAEAIWAVIAALRWKDKRAATIP